ncbi:MAG: hypothetical protein ACOZNI_09060 [Myxococcota bacterium]
MILFDFETPGLSDQWQMARGGSASREACETGGCLHVRPAPGSKVGSRRVPADWTGFGELTFRARATSATSIEVRVAAGERGAAWWRRVDLRAGEWQDVRVPLGWLRRAEGPAPSWSSVHALSFAFRDASEVWIDDVTLAEGSPVLTPEAIAAVTGGAVTRGRHAAVVSLVPTMDADGLAARLDAVADAVLADLPFLPPPAVPVPLVVFPDASAYRAGVVTIGAAFAADADTPGHDGFTLEGIATSSWDPAQGIGRPVYAHEFVHALLTRTAGLPNGGEWLQEGLATWYQARFHPQADLSEVVRGRLAAPLPMSRLCDGRRIEPRFYADAWAVVGTVLLEPAWGGTLERAFDAAARTGSTSLASLGVDLAALEADRRAWAARHFGW